MPAGSEAFFDWAEAEGEADQLAGEDPGLIVWIVEGWSSPSRYDDGCDADDLVVLWANTAEEAQDEVDSFAWSMWERQYDATKQKEAEDAAHANRP